MSLTAESPVAAAPVSDAPDLVVDALTVRFGGLVAVDNVSLRARGGVITGLIGPNGAGKTTTFNAATGLNSPTAGTVHLGDRTLDGHSAAWRARIGLGRTFQRMELFDTMTVAENIGLGREALLAGRRRWTGRLFATPAEGAQCHDEAFRSMEHCGIRHLAGATVGDLSTGQRRLVELARAMAGGFRFLLLDEPSSGLDVSETEQFAGILAALVEREGIGILLVEHDMALVRAVCSYIYVLDFGRLIYEGSAADVLSAEIVKAAYLGSEAVEAEMDRAV
ncbi:MAG TPA: ABC transporter ATP-binding protein [Acidimicrobiia bacterium]|nr:ABC transporter ATP-binding protein [Acidimicrobiia bacterium]